MQLVSIQILFSGKIKKISMCRLLKILPCPHRYNIEAFQGALGNRVIRSFISGKQKSKNEGNGGTKGNFREQGT